MELLYLWINRSDFDCIVQQEFNFSPLYKFKVDNIKNPQNISYESIETINLLKSSNNEGKINNITAVVGTNGSGKTTLLSFIARNNCHYKSKKRDGYERSDMNRYEHNKSIYVFIDNNIFIIYHNLEIELTCNFIILPENLYWNRCREDSIEQLCNVRKQLLVYLSNSSFVPEVVSGYSRGDKTYNVNLHQRSMYIAANRFYMSLFGKDNSIDNIKEDDDGFASVIKVQKNDKTFQELLDVQYYYFLIKHKIKDFTGNFKKEINVNFENIFNLIETKYHEDFEIIEETNKGYYKFSGQKPDKEPSDISRKYFKKIALFKEKYDFYSMEKARRENNTIILYFNLLFEAFFYEENFVLPDINFNTGIFEQIKSSSFTEKKYEEYLLDIKKLDDILSGYHMNENLIDNSDDLACSYDRVVCKENTDFYEYISGIFKERKSFVLRYIRIQKLEMSSGERAMQNMFSWLVLLPQLDEIMGMERATYESKLLLVDEIDLYSHPEWQRKIMNQLIFTINEIEKEKPIQIIVTSHSPQILSDFPRQNIIYMNKYDDKTYVDDNSKHKQSFGANIYTLLSDVFFLEKGAIGDFAKNKILDVYKELTSKKSLTKEEKKYYQKFIDMLGDNIIKNEMQKLFSEKTDLSQITIRKEVPKNMEDLKKLKKQLESSLDAVNNMLGEDRKG